MTDAMEVVEAVLDKLLKGFEDSTWPETLYGKMGLNWRKFQSSLKGWLTKTL